MKNRSALVHASANSAVICLVFFSKHRKEFVPDYRQNLEPAQTRSWGLSLFALTLKYLLTSAGNKLYFEKMFKLIIFCSFICFYIIPGREPHKHSLKCKSSLLITFRSKKHFIRRHEYGMKTIQSLD